MGFWQELFGSIAATFVLWLLNFLFAPMFGDRQPHWQPPPPQQAELRLQLPLPDLPRVERTERRRVRGVDRPLDAAPSGGSIELGLDQRRLAREADRAIATRNPALACAVKNCLHNLSVPGAAPWLDADALMYMKLLSPELDALCPHRDSVPFDRLIERARGRP